MAISLLSMKNGLSLTRDSRRDGLELVGTPVPRRLRGRVHGRALEGGGAWWGQRAAGSGHLCVWQNIGLT